MPHGGSVPWWAVMGGLTATGLTILASYLLGAIPFGFLVARWKGVNILRMGSGNIGATNVGRVLGRGYGILVFALDFAKGAAPVALAEWMLAAARPEARAFLEHQSLPVAAGLAAFLGHLFPVYLRFRGGKGVATGAGALAMLLPGPAMAALLTWIMVVCASRYVSLASLSAVVGLCLFHLVRSPAPWTGGDRVLTGFCGVAAALVLVRHRANLGRLLHGTENRLRETSAMLGLTKMIHLLALGVWLGTLVFFTFVAGLGVFHAFQELAETDAHNRPTWFPVPRAYARDPERWEQLSASDGLFTDARAIRREQGTRAAGVAVEAMFRGYFPLQVVCGLLAVSTALGWWRAAPGNRWRRARTVVLLFGVQSALGGWILERRVAEAQTARNQKVDALLESPRPGANDVRIAQLAVGDFRCWHAASLLANFVTLALVAAGMAMAVRLPTSLLAPAPEGVAPLKGR